MMVNEPWANALPGDELNQKLQQLVKKAQQHPPKTVERRMALNSLAQEILSSGHLSRLRNSPCPPHLYEDCYNEALQKTLMEISQKIDGYNPKYPVMAWVNGLLKYRFIDLVRDYTRGGITWIPTRGKEGGITLIQSNEERDGSSADEDSEVKQLRDFLQEDPEGLMKEKRIDKPPHPTFQDLAWAKYVEDKTWQEIARQTGLCVPTLSSFFQRTLRKLTPYFQKYLQS